MLNTSSNKPSEPPSRLERATRIREAGPVDPHTRNREIPQVMHLAMQGGHVAWLEESGYIID